MNAIQFIKDYGFTQAKECLSICASPNDKWFIHNGDLVSDSDFDDLKRLVESVDLVNELGGVEKCKGYIQVCFYKGRDMYGERLKQAIADYEAIYSNDCEILDYPEDYTSPNCKKYDERVK